MGEAPTLQGTRELAWEGINFCAPMVALSMNAVVAAAGVMWLTLLMTIFYQTAKLEASTMQQEDSMMQQLEHLKHESRLTIEASDNRQRDLSDEVASKVSRLESILELQKEEVGVRLAQIADARRTRDVLRSLTAEASRVLERVQSGVEWPMDAPGTRSGTPCILSFTSTTPRFRICTLDPEAHTTSGHLHKTGQLRLSKAWPVPALIKAWEGRGPPHFVDVGASIGYFSLFAATLNARVTALEAHPHELSLLRTSVGLNGLEERVEVKQVLAGEVDGVTVVETSGRTPDVVRVARLDDLFRKTSQTSRGAREADFDPIFVLRISAEGRELEVLQGAEQLLRAGSVSFMFVELSPTRLAAHGSSPLEVMRFLARHQYNIFDDDNAERGGLEDREFEAFAKQIQGSSMIFAARVEGEAEDAGQDEGGEV